ncbi:MAG TPA: FCD domain-containing protein [Nocardioidaceae bacterium]
MDEQRAGSPEPAPKISLRRTEKVSEVLAREIVRDLSDLPPATMLPSESAMLAKYGVGRASLREALRLLEVQGLIIMRPGPGGGPMVARADSAHYGRISSLYYNLAGGTYQDIVDARLVIEPAIARMVAEQSDATQHEALRRYVDDRPQRDPVTSEARTVDTAAEFHALLMGMCNNLVLQLLARSLQHVLLDRGRGVKPLLEWDRIEDDHATIARAIIDGDGDLTEELMRQHMAKWVASAKARHPGVLDEPVTWG